MLFYQLHVSKYSTAHIPKPQQRDVICSLAGQLYFTSGQDKREREKYIRTLWTAFRDRRRNVGGSKLIGPFRSSMWLLHSSCIRSVLLFCLRRWQH